MASVSVTDKKDNNNNLHVQAVHPQKFALWIGIASMIMVFAGLTSAYLVRKGGGEWIDFKIPNNFYLSTVLIVASSVTIHYAKRFFFQEKLNLYRALMGITLLLGIGFCVSQYFGWMALTDNGLPLTKNPSGDFLYAITGVHIVHVAVGMIVLTAAVIKSFIAFRDPAEYLIFVNHPNKRIRPELLTTYWHFVDLLWLYLLGFFLVT